MLRRIKNNNHKGQSMVEYTIVVGVIMMVLFAMNPMIKRSTQGMIKVMADQIGHQNQADQIMDDPDQGYLDEQFTAVRSAYDKTRLESAGVVNYVFGDTVNTEIKALMNLGFTPN